jgi:hypothetical protein
VRSNGTNLRVQRRRRPGPRRCEWRATAHAGLSRPAPTSNGRARTNEFGPGGTDQHEGKRIVHDPRRRIPQPVRPARNCRRHRRPARLIVVHHAPFWSKLASANARQAQRLRTVATALPCEISP